MTSYPPLYVLRHGETEWNAQNRLQGRFDSSLTASGKAQAAAQHSILKTRDLTGFVALTSPQGRAFHTASIALQGLVEGIDTDTRLREIGVGDWAGCARADLMAQEPDARDTFDLYERAPGGEGFKALRTRCTAFLDDLTSPTIVITHGITSRMLRLIVLGLADAALRDVPGGQGVVFHLEGGRQNRLTLGA
ncbi:MAG: histidine phosphatase family protein [Sulfitobacter sp.]